MTELPDLRALVWRCTGCGERFYPESTVREFERIQDRLEKGDTAEFKLMGQAFEAG